MEQDLTERGFSNPLILSPLCLYVLIPPFLMGAPQAPFLMLDLFCGRVIGCE